jgi:hypothetical protein
VARGLSIEPHHLQVIVYRVDGEEAGRGSCSHIYPKMEGYCGRILQVVVILQVMMITLVNSSRILVDEALY